MTLQEHLFSRHPDLIYCGWPPRETMQHVHDAIFLENQYLTNELIALAKSEAREKFHSPDHRVLFSREHLTVWTRNKGLIAERLKTVFGDVKIILMIREQISALESVYLWNLRNLGRPREALPLQPFDAFVEQQILDWRGLASQSALTTYDYGQYVRHYVSVLGRSNIGIFLFEELARTPNEFLRKFHQFVGIENPPQLDLGGKKENSRLTTWQFQFWRTTRYLTPYPVNCLLNRLLPRRALQLLERGPPMKAWLSDTWRKRLEEAYAPGNRFLVQEFGLPLQAHGYAL